MDESPDDQPANAERRIQANIGRTRPKGYQRSQKQTKTEQSIAWGHEQSRHRSDHHLRGTKFEQRRTHDFMLKLHSLTGRPLRTLKHPLHQWEYRITQTKIIPEQPRTDHNRNDPQDDREIRQPSRADF